MTEVCANCLNPLWVERLIVHSLKLDSSIRIDLCVSCLTDAFHDVLADAIDRVEDPKLRGELYRKWSKAGTKVRIDDLADILDN